MDGAFYPPYKQWPSHASHAWRARVKLASAKNKETFQSGGKCDSAVLMFTLCGAFLFADNNMPWQRGSHGRSPCVSANILDDADIQAVTALWTTVRMRHTEPRRPLPLSRRLRRAEWCERCENQLYLEINTAKVTSVLPFFFFFALFYIHCFGKFEHWWNLLYLQNRFNPWYNKSAIHFLLTPT